MTQKELDKLYSLRIKIKEWQKYVDDIYLKYYNMHSEFDHSVENQFAKSAYINLEKLSDKLQDVDETLNWFLND